MTARSVIAGRAAGEAAVEALGELRPVVGSLCGERAARAARPRRKSGGAAEASLESCGSRCTSQLDRRMEPSLARSTTARARRCARDRFVYGRLTRAADPYRSRTCHDRRARDARAARAARQSAAQDRHERGRRDHDRALARGPRPSLAVARGRPAQQLRAEHEPGLAAAQHERAVGEVVERGLVVQLRARAGRDALAVQLQVDRVGAGLARDAGRARSRPAARSRRAGRARRGGARPRTPSPRRGRTAR